MNQLFFLYPRQFSIIGLKGPYPQFQFQYSYSKNNNNLLIKYSAIGNMPEVGSWKQFIPPEFPAQIQSVGQAVRRIKK